MKKAHIKVYILIVLVTIIITRIVNKIEEIRNIVSRQDTVILYLVTQTKNNCVYSSEFFYFTIENCHQIKPGTYLYLVGTIDGSSDRDISVKKRLIISEKELYTPKMYSLKYWQSVLIYYRYLTWERLSKPFFDVLPYPASAVILSMLYGFKDDIDQITQENFLLTGTSHMQAVSGYNFAVISAGIYQAGSKLAGKRVQGITILIFACSFVYITGFLPSIIRAALSLIAFLITKFFLIRQYNSLFCLALVLLLLLLWQPTWLFSISFQLSAFATGGIILITPILNAIWQRVYTFYHFDLIQPILLFKICNEVVQALCVGLAASGATMPLLLWHFHEVNLIGILLTAITTSLISLLVSIGFWLSLIGLIISETVLHSLWGFLLVTAIYFPLDLFLKVLEYSSKLSFLKLNLETFGWIEVCISYSLLGAFIWCGQVLTKGSSQKLPITFL